MKLWRLMSFGGLVVVGAAVANQFSKPHAHPEPSPAYPYLRIRSRAEFPWGPNGLFESTHEEEHGHH
jgi:cytochrome c oxidase subunit 6a